MNLPQRTAAARREWTVTAEPTKVAALVRESWAARELCWMLARRDLVVRYRQTVAGVLWALARPLASMAVFGLLFGRFAHLPSEELPYNLFALAGLTVWTWLTAALSATTASVTRNTALVTKVYIPRLVLPVADLVASLADFAVSFGLVFAAALVWGKPGPGLLWLPVWGVLAFGFVGGLGVLLAAVNTRLRDVQQIVPYGLQLGLFLTPVVYPKALVPEGYGALLKLNPLTPLVDVFRAAVLGHKPVELGDVATLAAWAVAMLAVGLWSFARLERGFADAT